MVKLKWERVASKHSLISKSYIQGVPEVMHHGLIIIFL